VFVGVSLVKAGEFGVVAPKEALIVAGGDLLGPVVPTAVSAGVLVGQYVGGVNSDADVKFIVMFP